MISKAERLDVRSNPLLEELRFIFRNSRARKTRTMAEFAEQEIVVPTGKYRGKFKPDRQPYSRELFRAIDSGKYNTIATPGPVQSGKTLHCAVIPIMYHLFELRDTVVFAVPTKDGVDDKWQTDLLPVIEKTRYRDLLPKSGEGSRGGSVKNRVMFRNGAQLKFMSGGGSDKSRASFNTRVLVVTEVDGFGSSGESSEESNKLEQLVARTAQWGKSARIYFECTVTIEEGQIWQRYISGTESRLLKPCVHCGEYVAPEREHLQGWQTAETKEDAELAAAFFCPKCGQEYTEDERRAMCQKSKLVHKDQSLDRDGNLTGPRVSSDVLGFRWSAFDNLFLPTSEFAAREWAAVRSVNEEDEERKLCQFTWCRPYKPPFESVVVLNSISLQSRQHSLPQGLFPVDGEILTVGIDVGKSRLHWHAIAIDGAFRCRSINYGVTQVLSEDFGVEAAILHALREMREYFERGFAWQGHQETRTPDFVIIDAGYQQNTVMDFVAECNASSDTADRYWASKGFGFGQLSGSAYTMPQKGSLHRMLGEHYHIALIEGQHGGPLIEFDADEWKSFTHTRLSVPKDSPSALTFYATIPRDHKKLCTHLVAERQQLEYDPVKGERLVFKRYSRENHYLDATAIALLGGNMGGARLVEIPMEPAPAPPITTFTNHDGRAFVALDR